MLSGAGSGIANIAGIVIISKYFRKDIAMAQGIGSAGVGFGCFCLAPLEGYLIYLYGWNTWLKLLNKNYRKKKKIYKQNENS